MKIIRVNYIVALVIVALVAVLFVQAFQTIQMYDRKSSELEKNIATSLERITLRHEKAEDIRRYMHVMNRDFSGQYKDILKEEFKHLVSAQESISIHDTTLFINGEVENYLIIKGKTYDTLTGLQTEQRVLARDVRQLRELFSKKKTTLPHNDTVQLAIQLDQRVLQQIFKKAKFVNDLMMEAFRNNVYEEPAKRINIDFLDSIIRTEIANDNLPHTYQFMVTNENGEPIEFNPAPPSYSVKLDSVRTMKSVLFPSNTLDETLYLYLFFPKKSAFLFHEMWGEFVLSLTLMVLIVVALMIMFKTILTQEQLAEMKNDFISNMTHEFKTPISTISLACEALSDPDMTKQGMADIEPFVHMISDENKRLGVLVERILQSAVIDKGELKLRRETVNLNEIIREVAQHAVFRIKNSGGEIKLDLPKKAVIIEADKLHITNIVSNLVDNAIKYSETTPLIEISLKKENKKVYLSVKDHGIGIKKEHINKIFDKLYRVPTGNVHNVKGFGLGLSYVKAICELHGWNITVKSKFGYGTEFIIEMKEQDE